MSLLQRADDTAAAWDEIVKKTQHPAPAACFKEGYLAGYLAAMQELFTKRESPVHAKEIDV